MRSILGRETLNAAEATIFAAAEAWGAKEAARQGLALPNSPEAVRQALGEVCQFSVALLPARIGVIRQSYVMRRQRRVLWPR